MYRIHKHILPTTGGYCNIETHEIRQNLSVALDNGEIVLWEKVDIACNPSTVRFYISYTGVDLPDEVLNYVGTVQKYGVDYHVFEAPNF